MGERNWLKVIGLVLLLWNFYYAVTLHSWGNIASTGFILGYICCSEFD